MKNYTFIIFLTFIAFGIPSCATLVNSKYDYVAVETPNNEVVVLNGDTLKSKIAVRPDIVVGVSSSMSYEGARVDSINHLEFVYGSVRRDKKPLPVDIYARDTTYSYILRPNISNAFLFNLSILPLAPVGMGIDATTGFKWEYPSIYWYDDGYHSGDKNSLIRKQFRSLRYRDAFQKGGLELTISLPWTQFYYLNPSKVNAYTYDMKFTGLGIGLEYYYKEKVGLNLHAEGLLGYFLPFPFPIIIDYHCGGEEHRFRVANVSLTEVRHFRRFTIAYGIGLNYYNWKYIYYNCGDDDRNKYRPVFGTESMTASYWAIGPVVSGYVNITPRTLFGCTYRPTVYRFGISRPWKYEHTITLDLKFNIRLARGGGHRRG